jgi:hypothetical protein
MRRARASVALLGLLLLAACAQPPQAAIDAARSALDAASKSTDVVTYAPDQLRAARDAGAALDTELSAQMKKPSLMRRFDAVQVLADAAAKAATEATSTAATSKAQVAADAAALLDEVTASISDVEKSVWAARRVPRIKLDLIAAAAQVPNLARGAVENARKDIATGAFAAAKAQLLAAKAQLADAAQTVVEQARVARSR